MLCCVFTTAQFERIFTGDRTSSGRSITTKHNAVRIICLLLLSTVMRILFTYARQNLSNLPRTRTRNPCNSIRIKLRELHARRAAAVDKPATAYRNHARVSSSFSLAAARTNAHTHARHARVYPRDCFVAAYKKYGPQSPTACSDHLSPCACARKVADMRPSNAEHIFVYSICVIAKYIWLRSQIK